MEEKTESILKNGLEGTAASALAEAVMLSGEDGIKMCGDIVKIRETIMTITLSGEEDHGGPIMLDGTVALRNDESAEEGISLATVSPRFKDGYNIVPRVVQ